MKHVLVLIMLALAETRYPGWLGRLLIHRVQGLDNNEEMMRLLTEEKDAVKVFVEVAKDVGNGKG